MAFRESTFGHAFGAVVVAPAFLRDAATAVSRTTPSISVRRGLRMTASILCAIHELDSRGCIAASHRACTVRTHAISNIATPLYTVPTLYRHVSWYYYANLSIASATTLKNTSVGPPTRSGFNLLIKVTLLTHVDTAGCCGVADERIDIAFAVHRQRESGGSQELDPFQAASGCCAHSAVLSAAHPPL